MKYYEMQQKAFAAPALTLESYFAWISCWSECFHQTRGVSHSGFIILFLSASLSSPAHTAMLAYFSHQLLQNNNNNDDPLPVLADTFWIPALLGQTLCLFFFSNFSFLLVDSKRCTVIWQRSCSPTVFPSSGGVNTFAVRFIVSHWSPLIASL